MTVVEVLRPYGVAAQVDGAADDRGVPGTALLVEVADIPDLRR
ncbi:hypothetical protein [Mycobacterium sp.]